MAGVGLPGAAAPAGRCWPAAPKAKERAHANAMERRDIGKPQGLLYSPEVSDACRLGTSSDRSYTGTFSGEDQQAEDAARSVTRGRYARLGGRGNGPDVAAALVAAAGAWGPGPCRLFQFLPGGPGVRQCLGDWGGPANPGGHARKHRVHSEGRVLVRQRPARGHLGTVPAVHHFLLLGELRNSRQWTAPGGLSLG